MHYAGHPEHEPEVRLGVEHAGAMQAFYLHARCWNDWQLRRQDSDEYEVGYAHGIRDARA